MGPAGAIDRGGRPMRARPMDCGVEELADASPPIRAGALPVSARRAAAGRRRSAFTKGFEALSTPSCGVLPPPLTPIAATERPVAPLVPALRAAHHRRSRSATARMRARAEARKLDPVDRATPAPPLAGRTRHWILGDRAATIRRFRRRWAAWVSRHAGCVAASSRRARNGGRRGCRDRRPPAPGGQRSGCAAGPMPPPPLHAVGGGRAPSCRKPAAPMRAASTRDRAVPTALFPKNDFAARHVLGTERSVHPSNAPCCCPIEAGVAARAGHAPPRGQPGV